MTKPTHAIFVSLNHSEPSFEPSGKNPPHIVLVPSEEAGINKLADGLVQCGMAMSTTDGFREVVDGEPSGGQAVTAAELVEGFKDGLGGSEYYHVYEIVNPE